MKILYLSHHFHTATGTFSSRPYLFAKELTSQGHQVTVVTGKHDRGAVEIEEQDSNTIRRTSIEGIDIVQVAVPYANKMSLFKRSLVFIRYTWECIRQSMTGDYDLVFGTSGPLTVGLPGILSKYLRSKTFIFEVRDLLPESPKQLGLIKSPCVLASLATLEHLSYKAADAIIALAPGAVASIKSKVSPATPVALLPNGSELDRFKKRPDGKLNLDGINPEDTVAIFTGAHGVANGIPAILDAAQELIRRGRKDIKFVFFGNGKIKPEMVSRKAKEGLENCLFFDPVPKPALADILGCADIGLMVLRNIEVFHYSTSPNKFFDYLSSGLPIITNYPGWVADLITHNDSGVAVPPHSPEAFADAISEYADNPKLRTRQGNNGRSLAEDNFDMKKISKQFVQFVEKITVPPSLPVV